MDSFKTTKEALNALTTAIITAITGLVGQFGSSRMWAFVGTLAAGYFEAVQLGLRGQDLVVAVAATVLTGGTFIISKTIRTGAPAATNSTTEAKPPVPLPVANPPSLPLPIPVSNNFNQEKFMEAVTIKAASRGEVNNTTLLYAARDIVYGNEWDFANILELKSARDLIVILSYKSFIDIWGTSFDEELYRPAIPDCTIDDFKTRAVAKGEKFYVAYLNVIRAKEDREKLD